MLSSFRSTASVPSESKTTPADKPKSLAVESKSRSTTPQTVKHKVTGSAADGSSAEKLVKTSNLEKTSKKATIKKDAASKAEVPESQHEDKPTLEKSELSEKESVAKETAEVDKPDSQVEMCSAEPEQSGEDAGGTSEPMEAECVDDCKEENQTAFDVEGREPSAEGPSESQPSTSTPKIPAAEAQTAELGR